MKSSRWAKGVLSSQMKRMNEPRESGLIWIVLIFLMLIAAISEFH